MSRRNLAITAITLLMSIGAFSMSGSQSTPSEFEEAIRLRLPSEPPSLNPITADGDRALEIRSYIVETLLGRDENTFAWRGALADKWKISSDGLEFEFSIREGALWSDGQPVTSEDVKFSFDVINDDRYPTANIRPFYIGIDRVEIISPISVRFIAKQPIFTNFESVANLPIVPKHVYGDPEMANSLHRKVIGSGPYVLSRWDAGQRIVLTRNPRWWGRNNPPGPCREISPRIVFQIVGDDSMAVNLLERGELDFLPLTPDLYIQTQARQKAAKSFETARVRNRMMKMHYGIGFNLRKPLFQDPRVRTAFNMLADRETISRKFFAGAVRPAAGPWNSQAAGADSSIQPIAFDRWRALELLREAGWDDHDDDHILDKVVDGKRVPLEVTILTWTKQMERVLTLLREDARSIGVLIQVRMVPAGVYGRVLDAGDFEMADLSGPLVLTDFDPTSQWHSASATSDDLNFGAYSNPVVDETLNSLRASLDQREREENLKVAYRTISADLPEIFLFEEADTFYAYSKRVRRPAETYNYDLGVKCWRTDSVP